MSSAPRPSAFTRAALTIAAFAFATLRLARPAAAQVEPKFTFAKPEEAKPQAQPQAPAVEWKAQAKGGLILTSGNSEATNVTGGLTVSRKEGNNKLALDGGVAYGQSNNYIATVDTTTNTITALDRQAVTTTNNWFSKGRYDRFFTANNSGYVSGQIAGDKIAGKAFVGGGQLGYSRQILKTDNNTLVGEIGYDFSYESYVQQPMKTLDPVSIHSARLFVGETAKITSSMGATASVEAFFNLNKETKALNVDPPHDPGVAPFHDTRVIGKLGVSTNLFKSLSAALSFSIRYDQNPAPLPIPSGAPAGSTFAAGFQPFAQTTDTASEVTVIYTFF